MRTPQETPSSAIQGKILVVDDDALLRAELSRALARRDFQARSAASLEEACAQENTGDLEVIVVDRALVVEPGGKEAAQALQTFHPHAAFVFWSGSAPDPAYRQRIRESGVRTGGFVVKSAKVAEILELIEKESRKARMRARLEEALARGLEPYTYLHATADHDPSFTPQVLEELESELLARQAAFPQPIEEVHPLREPAEMPDLGRIEGEIDRLYGEIQAIVERQRGAPGLRQALQPLRERLCELQEMEADALELRFRQQLRFDPEEGRQLLSRLSGLRTKR